MYKGLSEESFEKISKYVSAFADQETKDLAADLLNYMPGRDSAISQLIVLWSNGQEPDQFLLGKVLDELKEASAEEASETEYSDDDEYPELTELDKLVMKIEDYIA